VLDEENLCSHHLLLKLVQNLQFPMQGFLSLLPVLSTLITGQTVRSASSIFHDTCTKRKHHQWHLALQVYNSKLKMSPVKRNIFTEMAGWSGKVRIHISKK
jgi:hypothetical protein